MIAVKFCVWADKKDGMDVRFLTREVEAFVKEHCKKYKQTYVMDAEVRTFVPPEEGKEQDIVVERVVEETQEH